MDDAELFKAWVGGDQSAGESLYGRYFDPLYRFFRSKAPDDYEDLIQTTMLECVRSRDRFQGNVPFRAYLFGVARHRLLHHLRRKGTNRIDLDASQTSVADVDPRPSSIMARKAEQQLLLEAMRRVPVDLQIAMELHYWEERTPSDPNPAKRRAFGSNSTGSQGVRLWLRVLPSPPECARGRLRFGAGGAAPKGSRRNAPPQLHERFGGPVTAVPGPGSRGRAGAHGGGAHAPLDRRTPRPRPGVDLARDHPIA